MATAIDIHAELSAALQAGDISSACSLCAALSPVLEADRKETLRSSARIKLLEKTVKKQQSELKAKDERIARLVHDLWANSADNYDPLNASEEDETVEQATNSSASKNTKSQSKRVTKTTLRIPQMSQRRTVPVAAQQI